MRKRLLLWSCGAFVLGLAGCGGGTGAGHGILFTRGVPSHDGCHHQIFSWRPGSGMQRVGRSADDMGSPAWSPGGAEIAFDGISGDCGRFIPGQGDEIYVMRADGTHITQVTHDFGGDVLGAYAPSWSPDGSRIVYLRWLADRVYSQLVVISPHSGHEVLFPVVDRPFAQPTWGRAGIAYLGRRGIMLLDPATGHSRVFIAATGTKIGSIAWSPRGELAALEGPYSRRVVVYSAVGRPVERFLVPFRFYGSCVIWSPDGRRLLLPGRYGVWTIDRNGTHPRELSISPLLACPMSWR